MNSMTEPTMTHPAWCDPRGCGTDARETFHWSADVAGPFGITATLGRHDQPDTTGSTVVYVEGRVPDGITPDQLGDVGRWLIEQAAAFRAAIETEGGR